MEFPGYKVEEIIEENFDTRLSIAVVTYILDCGFENLKQVTEEDVLKIKGNALMTDQFAQAMVRTAAMICKECKQIDDFLPYVINYLYVPKAKMHDVWFHQDQMTKWKWETFIHDLDIDFEEDTDEIGSVRLLATVLETYRKDE